MGKSPENRQKLTMVCSPFEKIIRFPSVDVLGVFYVPGKVFNLDLDFSIFFFQNVKMPLTESLKSTGLRTIRNIFLDIDPTKWGNKINQAQRQETS